MIKPNDNEMGDGPSSLTRMVLVALGALMFVFALGVAAGLTSAIIEHGVTNPLKLALVVFVVVAMLAGSAWFLRHQAKAILVGPVAPRVRRARWIMGLLLALGLLTGIFVPHGSLVSDPAGLVEDPLSPVTAIAMVIAWCVLVPIVTVIWWRNVDELEQAGYRDGAFWAANFYTLVTPAWWLLWRAGIAGEPWHMAIFVAAMLIWTLIWFVRRYA